MHQVPVFCPTASPSLRVTVCQVFLHFLLTKDWGETLRHCSGPRQCELTNDRPYQLGFYDLLFHENHNLSCWHAWSAVSWYIPTPTDLTCYLLWTWEIYYIWNLCLGIIPIFITEYKQLANIEVCTQGGVQGFMLRGEGGVMLLWQEMWSISC